MIELDGARALDEFYEARGLSWGAEVEGCFSLTLAFSFSSGHRRTTWSRAAIYPPGIPPEGER